jgi:hypothetical protein
MYLDFLLDTLLERNYGAVKILELVVVLLQYIRVVDVALLLGAVDVILEVHDRALL